MLRITAEAYESWSEERRADIEIVDGVAVVRPPGTSKRRLRLARILANALDAAGGSEWNADTHCDIRLRDVPLTNLRPDVVVYRADTLDITPTRPEHMLLVAEVVCRGRADCYAKAGIGFYWRVEQAATGVPLVYTYVLDPVTMTYREGDVFTGTLKAAAPFPVEIDLSEV